MNDGRERASAVVVASGPGEISLDAAYRFTAIAAAAVQARKRFCVALAGGNTPALLYRLLTASPFKDAIEWTKTELFFGDERCVPVDSEYSNYRMARETLFDPLGLSPANIHRIPADLPDADQAATQYQSELGGFFGASDFPRFDLILLGMGPDGHCASLFPGKDAVSEKSRWVVATPPGLKPFVPRISLTLPVLNAAANVLFLVAGQDKTDTIVRVFAAPCGNEELPAQLVEPHDGTLTWLLDRSAARKLSFSDE